MGHGLQAASRRNRRISRGAASVEQQGEATAGGRDAGVSAGLRGVWGRAGVARDRGALGPARWPRGAWYGAAHALLAAGFGGRAAVYGTVFAGAIG